MLNVNFAFMYRYKGLDGRTGPPGHKGQRVIDEILLAGSIVLSVCYINTTGFSWTQREAWDSWKNGNNGTEAMGTLSFYGTLSLSLSLSLTLTG